MIIDRRNPAQTAQFRTVGCSPGQLILPDEADITLTVDPAVERRALIEADQMIRAVLARRRHRR
jgi:hypothetical protein